MAPQPATLFFDDHCGLCGWWAQLVRSRDRQHRFTLETLSSDAGLAAAKAAGLPHPAQTLIVRLPAGRFLLRSDAALFVARQLGLPISLLAVGYLVPRPLRDALYNVIARNRYRFGVASCGIPNSPRLPPQPPASAA